ncbi:hypothetical protein ACIO8F_07940 [Streptomyces sp. NPDC087228]|uniref:hypothetical protein n=1 Tax=Streptomyces sp. NPDC087228 TaxID=3365772 RepID=UPI0038082CF6
MAFPEDPLGLRAELLLGGVWTDITRDVYTREPISIVHGTSSEGAQPDPASCSLLLNNEGGRYSPRNPLSPYYGLIGRNTPVRVTVPGPESYLALNGTPGTASTPAVPDLAITGDIDIRVEVTADWQASGAHTLIGRWNSTAGHRSWLLSLDNGLLRLDFSTTGTESSGYASLRLPPLPERAAVRATLDVDNGSGGWTAALYWARSLDGPWVQIGSDLPVPGPVSIHAGSAPLTLAPTAATASPPWTPITGRVHRAEVRAGINGAVRANPNFRTVATGATTVTDAAGRVWALTGAAEITTREGLFAGEVSEWPPRWSASEKSAWVPVQAAGILRRLGQGRRPLQSTLRRRIPSAPGLLAYWPMEDGAVSTQMYSPMDGVTPLRVSGLEMAADSSLPGSAPLPTLGSVASLSATVPTTKTAGWHTEMVFRLPSLPSIQAEIIRVSVAGSGTLATVHVFASSAGIRLEGRDAEGAQVAGVTHTDGRAIAAFSGPWNRLALFTSPNPDGPGSRLTAAWRDVLTGEWWYAYFTIPGPMGRVTAIRGSWGSAAQGMALGHLAAFSVPAPSSSQAGVTIYAGADRGFARETAVNRLVRLATEEPALLMAIVDGDGTADSEQMGPQGQVELMTLVGEVVETDGGILYERMDRLGLVYRDRATLYNQRPAITLDYAGGQIAPPLEPTDDDAELRNDVTVTRSGGSSGRAVVESGPLSVLPPEQGGVGLYEEAVTLSLGTDDQPERIAGWRAHLGTWDEARYPTVRVRLHQHPDLIPAVLALRPGDLLRIINPPMFTGPGPLDLLVRQIQHQPLPRTWEVTLSCTPAGPYRVGVVDDRVFGRADTDGSALAAAVLATGTTLPVATTVGRPWVTDPAEFPFDVQLGGEVVTVHSISGSIPQTFNVTRAVNGIRKPHPTKTDVRLAVPTIVAL